MQNPYEETDFGFQKIPKEQKQGRVAEIFHAVATQYDVMNDLMSFGLHRLWKRFAVAQTQLQRGDYALDVAGGTGDLTKLLLDRVGPTGRVVLSDINHSMLTQGRARLTNRNYLHNVDYVEADAEKLPFADNQFDGVMIGFGLRNVTDKTQALAEMYRVLKPGKKLIILEFSTPTLSGLKRCYDQYSFNLIPKIGGWIAGDRDSYRYLVESIRRHPDQAALRKLVESAGFSACGYYNLNAGIVAVHYGYKIP